MEAQMNWRPTMTKDLIGALCLFATLYVALAVFGGPL